MYQYIAGDGGNLTWTKLFKLTPNIYSENTQRTFADGEIQVNIPIAAIVPVDQIGSYNAANFNVQCSILGNNPIAHVVSVSEIAISNDLVSLPITIKGVEYSSNEWIPLSGAKTVHLLITVV